MSHFEFLRSEWPAVYEATTKAESLAYPDSRGSCFYARRALELAVQWVYKHDPSLKLPYQEHLSALLHDPTFRKAAGDAVFSKARVVMKLGNEAVHSQRPIRQYDAIASVRELFHFSYWFARTYARQAKPAENLTFDQNLLPRESPASPQTRDQLTRLETQLRERDERLSTLLADNAALDEQLAKVRAEVAAARAANATQPDHHDYSEEETRDYFIDLLLRESGWPLLLPQEREYEVSGMPNVDGIGYVDYVLWGDDGKPLAVIEAKRTKRDPRVGQQQAKLYADCLEQRFGRRPVIFYSNGYTHWIWDDQDYPPRAVQGFLKKDELELLIQRRDTRRGLGETAINENIVERHYQTRAIRRISEAFERDKQRKALVVMATGAGKTRTVIALADLLMRCNWAKRILFLADRIALVNQAVGAFKKHLPDAAPVNLVTEKDGQGRVYVSTYPTMMGLIDDTRDGQRRFGVGHFDLVVIDEAHRSVFQKYRTIFEYFDSLLVGLTATPKDEVDRNTYSLFELEDGVPTDAYSLDEAVRDGFLVPSKPISVPLKFQREGISYDQLSEEEKEQWDALEWDEEGEVPDRVEAEAVNKWLFNKDTVDKVLEHVMTRGQKVAGGDRLGKTIVFAKNHHHAKFIAERFDANYPHLHGHFARVIDFQTEYAQSLIDDFSKIDKQPHIAISVDMLDTGIDVPEVVNLVFFKIVRSKTKFWQMVGRGTRLCPDLFGPGKHKEFFYLFDYCQNLEFFKQNPGATDGAVGASLATRLFRARLELIGHLDQRRDVGDGSEAAIKAEHELRREVVELLRNEVSAMNLDNFIVRPKRQWVEKYGQPEAWETLPDDALEELAHQVAGLPTELDPEAEESKRFDLLVLNLQLALLQSEPSFTRLRDHVKVIAGLLEEKASIPMVREQMPLILDLQTEEWWQEVTTPMLESMRKRMRALVALIEKRQRKPIYTDFEDELGDEQHVSLPGLSLGDNFERFRAKARAFLREHQDHVAVHKLRMNLPLSTVDLEELERMLAGSGVGSTEDIRRARDESHGLGVFVRSLIGLDREAAKQVFATFLTGKTLNSNQIEFVNLIIDHLTENGVLDPGILYESPFTDLSPQGPDGLFSSTQVDELVAALERVRSMAVAA